MSATQSIDSPTAATAKEPRWTTDDGVRLRHPMVRDGGRMHELARQTPPLEANSAYSYLLMAYHFHGTCLIAEAHDRLLGFVTGYRPPVADRVLFVWQVAVHPDARGRGLGARMLQRLLASEGNAGVRYLEATVTPTNRASQALFRGLATKLQARCDETDLFSPVMFGGQEHETERLYRIGPFAQQRQRSGAAPPDPIPGA